MGSQGATNRVSQSSNSNINLNIKQPDLSGCSRGLTTQTRFFFQSLAVTAPVSVPYPPYPCKSWYIMTYHDHVRITWLFLWIIMDQYLHMSICFGGWTYPSWSVHDQYLRYYGSRTIILIISHPPVITIFIGGMFPIPSHGWFMTLFYPHCISIYPLAIENGHKNSWFTH